MSVTRDEFSARLRSLFNIDHADVKWITPIEYQRFARDPVGFFIRADDETQEQIWTVVEWRNRPRSRLFDACAEVVRTGLPTPLPLGNGQ